MAIKRAVDFYNEITGVPESAIEVIILPSEVNGKIQFQTFGTGTYTGLFQGKLTSDSEYVNINVLNNTTNTAGTGFSASGIYTLEVGGLYSIQVVVSILTGGNLTVKSKII